MRAVAVRLAVALAVILPYVLLPVAHPIWLTFLVALAAFGLGRLALLAGRAAPLLAIAAVVAGGVAVLVLHAGGRGGPRADVAVSSDDVAASPDRYRGQTLHVHGWVAAGSMIASPEGRRFDVESGRRRLRVRYDGILPDGFRDRTEVVLRGQLTVLPDGTTALDADQLLARCPSSYPVPPRASAP